MHHLVEKINKCSWSVNKSYQVFLLIADLVLLVHLFTQFNNFPLQLTDSVIQHHFTSAKKHKCVKESLDVPVWLRNN